MQNFIRCFSDAMELCCLGLYEKVQNKSDQVGYNYSPLLKKALDKFTLLNITYSLISDNGKPLLPTHEAALIKAFNSPLSNLIDKLPCQYRESLRRTEWYCEENLVTIGLESFYYCTEELLDRLNNNQIYRKANIAFNKELELENQKFIRLLFERDQDEYVEIRDFFEQRSHVYLTGLMYLENDEIRRFKNKYPEIFNAAYEKLNYENASLKICHHCGLVLRELTDGTLYCVSERCSRKSKGFSTYDPAVINGEQIWVLRLNVSRYIYYPGILEQSIREGLKKAQIPHKLWPNHDEWDLEFVFEDKTCVVDAKDVKNPNTIKDDIILKQNHGIKYDKVIYVVPNDRKSYLDVVRRVIQDQRIQCITLLEFKRMINER